VNGVAKEIRGLWASRELERKKNCRCEKTEGGGKKPLNNQLQGSGPGKKGRKGTGILLPKQPEPREPKGMYFTLTTPGGEKKREY